MAIAEAPGDSCQGNQATGNHTHSAKWMFLHIAVF
jgi:hypothetical protein